MKIGIVGAGLVGSTSAYAMIMSGIGREIVLVDKNAKRAGAEANDLLHAVPFAQPLKVSSGDYSDLARSRIVVLSAGVAQKPGETRLELLKRNAAVFSEIVPAVLEHAPQAVLIVATNPVDIMTHIAARYASSYGVPASRVVGTGTTLDTARFRALLGQYLGVDPQHVHAYVIGEHGDSEVLTWSLVIVGAMTLSDFCSSRGVSISEDVRQRMDSEVRNAAYAIIQGKGATYYGIGSAVAKIADVVIHDQRSILTVSGPVRQVGGIKNLSFSMPRLIGGDGVVDTLELRLDAREQEALEKSAAVVKQAVEELEV